MAHATVLAEEAECWAVRVWPRHMAQLQAGKGHIADLGGVNCLGREAQQRFRVPQVPGVHLLLRLPHQLVQVGGEDS